MARKRGGDNRIYLNEDEKAELINFRREAARQRQRRELNRRKFEASRAGKIGRVITSIPRQVSRGKLPVGRPRGRYDPRYAAYGGVYNFRKVQSQQRTLQRLQFQRDANLSPEEQAALNQIRAKQAAQRLNPESRVIPDTDGRFDFRNIFKEIEEASQVAG